MAADHPETFIERLIAAPVTLEQAERLADTLSRRRLDLNPVEAVTLGRFFEPFLRVAAYADRGRPSGKKRPQLGGVLGGEFLDRLGGMVGMGRTTYERAEAVIKAADLDPEAYGDLEERMERTGRVNGAYGELRKREDRERVAHLAPVDGRFRTLVVDPPWRYESGAPERGILYADMGEDDILALPVPEWADERCHLWLWTTNFHMPLALRCVEAWGFEHKAVLTWLKPKIGQGWYLRNNTEQCLLGVRGNLPLAVADIPSYFTADVGEHSEKPEEFYQIVRRASYHPIGEAFQRTSRDGFCGLYAAPEAA